MRWQRTPSTRFSDCSADEPAAAPRSCRCSAPRGSRRPTLGTREAHLGDRYGTLTAAIDELIAKNAELAQPLVQGLPYLRAEAVYAARHEMATTLVDVLTRRTRVHLLDREATLGAAPGIADLLADELGWDDTERRRQLADYHELVAKEEADCR